MDTTETWQAVLGELEVALSKPSFITWFKDTSLLSCEKDKAIICLPSAFYITWFRKHYHNYILKALKKYHPDVKRIEYQAVSREVNAQLKTPSQPAAAKPLFHSAKPQRSQQAINLNPNFTFENFVVGPSNRLAFASTQAVAQKPGRLHNPLFIYGGVGLGKTHLLNAIGNTVIQKRPKIKILYVHCENFCNEYINSIQTQTTSNFKKKYRSVQILLVDDIQFLSKKEGTQEEFFHTFNSLQQKNCQIVMTSDRLPRDIPYLEERLSSRFGGGMVADIQPPNSETRQAILKNKALNKGWVIPDEVIEYIALNVKTNIRELEGALNRLVAQALISQQDITKDFTKKTLDNIIRSSLHKNFDPHQVIKKVAEFFNLKEKDILGKSRQRKLVRPRQIVMYLLRDELKLTLPKIGEILGGKDHTTIIYGIKLIKSLIKKEQNIEQEITLIKESLHSAE
jgi:chromosomal replication initiator protein